MTERQYISATNRVKMSMARMILKGIKINDDPCIDNAKLMKIEAELLIMESNLFSNIDMEESE